MKKCVYIIFAADYNNGSGGNLASHSLAENLSLLGEEVYITCKYKRNHSLVKSIQINSDIWSFLSKEDTIVIYPEVISDNPLDAKHICRWLLNNPGALKKFDQFVPEGVFYKFNKYYNYPNYGKEIPILNTYISKVKTFTPPEKNITRERIIYSLRTSEEEEEEKLKRYPIQKNWELMEYKYIDKTIFDVEIRKIFRTSKYYISYDHCTYLTVLAALCGCIPIVIPTEKYTNEEWKNIFPLQRFGVAYGFEDIEHAKQTLHLAKDNVLEIQKSSIKSILDFNDYWYKRLFNIDSKVIKRKREEKLINGFVNIDLRDLYHIDNKESREKKQILKIIKIKSQNIILKFVGYRNFDFVYSFFKKVKNSFFKK